MSDTNISTSISLKFLKWTTYLICVPLEFIWHYNLYSSLPRIFAHQHLPSSTLLTLQSPYLVFIFITFPHKQKKCNHRLTLLYILSSKPYYFLLLAPSLTVWYLDNSLLFQFNSYALWAFATFVHSPFIIAPTIRYTVNKPPNNKSSRYILVSFLNYQFFRKKHFKSVLPSTSSNPLPLFFHIIS